MDDPRLAGQQVKIDYPHLGRYERTKVVTEGMRKAGLLKEDYSIWAFMEDFLNQKKN